MVQRRMPGRTRSIFLGHEIFGRIHPARIDLVRVRPDEAMAIGSIWKKNNKKTSIKGILGQLNLWIIYTKIIGFL